MVRRGRRGGGRGFGARRSRTASAARGRSSSRGSPGSLATASTATLCSQSLTTARPAATVAASFSNLTTRRSPCAASPCSQRRSCSSPCPERGRGPGPRAGRCCSRSSSTRPPVRGRPAPGHRHRGRARRADPRARRRERLVRGDGPGRRSDGHDPHAGRLRGDAAPPRLAGRRPRRRGRRGPDGRSGGRRRLVYLGVRLASDPQGYVDPLGFLPVRATPTAPRRNCAPAPAPVPAVLPTPVPAPDPAPVAAPDPSPAPDSAPADVAVPTVSESRARRRLAAGRAAGGGALRARRPFPTLRRRWTRRPQCLSTPRRSRPSRPSPLRRRPRRHRSQLRLPAPTRRRPRRTLCCRSRATRSASRRRSPLSRRTRRRHRPERARHLRRRPMSTSRRAVGAVTGAEPDTRRARDASGAVACAASRRRPHRS